jgi:hypothetical protein
MGWISHCFSDHHRITSINSFSCASNHYYIIRDFQQFPTFQPCIVPLSVEPNVRKSPTSWIPMLLKPGNSGWESCPMFPYRLDEVISGAGVCGQRSRVANKQGSWKELTVPRLPRSSHRLQAVLQRVVCLSVGTRGLGGCHRIWGSPSYLHFSDSCGWSGQFVGLGQLR